MLSDSTRRKQVDKLKARFDRLDHNHDGLLSFKELKKLLRKGDPLMTERDAQVLFKMIDKDDSGYVNFHEFVDYVFSPTSDEEILSPGATPRTSLSRGASPRRPASAVEVSGVDWEQIKDAYHLYAGANGKLEAWEFVRMCEHAKLFDSKFDRNDADITFRQIVPVGRRYMEKAGFRRAMHMISERKGCPVVFVRGQTGAQGEADKPDKALPEDAFVVQLPMKPASTV